VVIYLASWGLTWAFGRDALSRHFADHYASRRNAQGEPVFADVREGTRFAGEGFDFWPDPIPGQSPWACVGRPVAPTPFLVYTDYAYLRGGLDGGAGRAYFLWTPWKLYWLGSESYWSA